MKFGSIRFTFFTIIFPLTALAFIGQGVTIVNFFISGNLRWIFLLILFIYLLINNRWMKCFNSPLLICFGLYAFWCLLTSLWSEVPLLSLMKSSILFFIAVTFASAGSEWVRRYGWENSLNWIGLILWIILLSGVFGLGSGTEYGGTGLSLYRGLTGGSNVFGFVCAVTFPLLVWRNRRKKIFWKMLLLLMGFFLLRSFARSSILMVIIMVIFWVLSLHLKKKVFMLCLTGLILSACALIVPSFLENHIYKYKPSINSHDVFSTRRDVWNTSYNAALEGGFIGVGYGASVGKKTDFISNGFSFVTYGREKGNSQLAAVEETGLIGLSLFVIFLTTFFIYAISVWRSLSGDKKNLFGISMGIMFGILAESVFEAWWSGPASQENVYFWSMFGVVRGLTLYMRRNDGLCIH